MLIYLSRDGSQTQSPAYCYTRMALASFGTDTASHQELQVVTVEIEAITGDHIPISVLVIPSIAALIHNSINTSVRNMSYLQGLKLAHPVTSDHKLKYPSLSEQTIIDHSFRITLLEEKGPLHNNPS